MEAFVARHVVAMLFFNGDIEGESTGNDSKFLGCIGRREVLVIALYLATVIPALFLDNIGPVLSITGSLGGSCVAYIGPGLIYFGVHGDEFIEYTNMLLGKHPHTDTQIELPVAGDAGATIDQSESQPAYNPESKPWWWFVGLFPIWRAIASTGAIGMKFNLEQLEQDNPGCTSVQPEGEIIRANTRNYYVAMFFIAFGAVAALVGLISNIYVELEKVFYSPH